MKEEDGPGLERVKETGSRGRRRGRIWKEGEGQGLEGTQVWPQGEVSERQKGRKILQRQMAQELL